MPEANGSHDWRAEMDERIKRLEAAHKELEDSFIVMTHLETKMGQVLKQQAEYVSSHEQRLQAVDERIEKLVSAIGELVARIPPEAFERKR